MNNIFEKLTNQLRETLDSSVALALHNKNQEVEVIHMFWALITNTSSVLNQLLNKMNIDKTAIELETKSTAAKLVSVSSLTKENIKLLGTIPMAIIARMTRASMIEVMKEEYIRTARAKGCSNMQVIMVHALKNALLPVLTVVGLMVGTLFAGAILTETTFSWPGIGKWLINAVHQRDFPIIQSTTLIIASMFVMVNLIVDVLYAVVNPRIRLS